MNGTDFHLLPYRHCVLACNNPVSHHPSLSACSPLCPHCISVRSLHRAGCYGRDVTDLYSQAPSSNFDWIIWPRIPFQGLLGLYLKCTTIMNIQLAVMMFETGDSDTRCRVTWRHIRVSLDVSRCFTFRTVTCWPRGAVEWQNVGINAVFPG